MSSEAINSTITEPVKEAQEAPKETIEIQQEPEKVQDVNWRQFREERKRLREEKESMERKAKQKEEEAAAFKQAMEAILNKPTAELPASADEKEDLRKWIQEEFKKEKERQYLEEKKREVEELPKKIAQTMPDFNVVCSEDNVDYLEYHFPEVAVGFNHMPDGFDKWNAIYRAIKRLVPNAVNSNKDKAKAERNLAKPQSMSTGGLTETSDQAPMYLDESKKAANWQRMQKRMRGI